MAAATTTSPFTCLCRTQPAGGRLDHHHRRKRPVARLRVVWPAGVSSLGPLHPLALPLPTHVSLTAQLERPLALQGFHLALQGFHLLPQAMLLFLEQMLLFLEQQMLLFLERDELPMHLSR